MVLVLFFCSPYNTLYLELHCPAVAPSVVVTSNNGKSIINFGDVAVGMTETRSFSKLVLLSSRL